MSVVAITEAELQEQVLELARLLRWRVAHFRPAMTKHGWRTPVAGDGKGFPDLVLVRDRVVVVELKSDRGRVSEDQEAWLEAFRAAGVEALVVRPSGFDELVEVLR